ncbi:MAG: hypothetical protein KBA13_03845 [Chitinophagales bacterium]|nr:hypothetical protein [Chitinophagales bacterium]
MKKEINKNKGQNKFLGLMNLDSSFGIWKTIFILIFFFLVQSSFSQNGYSKAVNIYFKAYNYYSIDSFELAVKYSSVAIKKNKDCDACFYIRSFSNFILGNYQSAYLDFKKLAVDYDTKNKKSFELNSIICKSYIKTDNGYIEDFKQYIKNSNDTIYIAKCYAFLNEEEKALEILNNYRLNKKDSFMNQSIQLAEIYSLLNKKEEAFSCLDNLLNSGYKRFNLIEFNKCFDNLKTDSRFNELLIKNKSIQNNTE